MLVLIIIVLVLMFGVGGWGGYQRGYWGGQAAPTGNGALPGILVVVLVVVLLFLLFGNGLGLGRY